MTPLFDEQKFRTTLPPEMLQERRWVRYFLDAKPGGGFSKVPIGSHSDSATWSKFEDCVAALQPEQGLGYVFTVGDIQPLDLDHCRNAKTGEVCPEAMVLLRRFASWSEVSVSGQGLHVLFIGDVRAKQLNETCMQFWNAKYSPRFIALTCDLVGDEFTKLKDVGFEANYPFSTARHISAKIREELKTVDPEQWAALPAEREQPAEAEREKPKTKTRKVASGFDIKDFLAFYNLPIDNETDNELGHCIRLSTCPIKGEPHVGQNSTSTNFIFPCKDDGLAFHCQSTGCVDYSASDVIQKLAEDQEPYPKPIYVAEKDAYKVKIVTHRANTIRSETWEWVVSGYLPKGAEVHLFAGKGRGKTKVCNYFNKLANDQGMRVIRFNMEDHEGSILKPTMYAAGCNLELTEVVDRAALGTKDGQQMRTSVDFSKPECVAALRELITEFGDVGLV